MSTIRTFDDIEYNHGVCRGQDFMKKFCEFSRGHSMKVINFEKKKIITLTKERWKFYKKTKICYICQKNI